MKTVVKTCSCFLIIKNQSADEAKASAKFASGYTVAASDMNLKMGQVSMKTCAYTVRLKKKMELCEMRLLGAFNAYLGHTLLFVSLT